MSSFMDTEAFRCAMECDDMYDDRHERESTYGTIGRSDGMFCAASGCTRPKHPHSKYCAHHKTHRPRSEAAYRRMADRPWAGKDGRDG